MIIVLKNIASFEFQTGNSLTCYVYQQSLRRILIVVRARNQKYDRSPTFSTAVHVPKRNLADNIP